MNKETKNLMEQALLARSASAAGLVGYDEAMVTVKRYTDHANKKAVAIAKRFGMKPKMIDPKGFMR